MSVKLRLGLAEPTGGVTVILLSLDHTATNSSLIPPVQTKSRLGLMAAGESGWAAAATTMGFSAVLTFQRVLVVSVWWCGVELCWWWW